MGRKSCCNQAPGRRPLQPTAAPLPRPPGLVHPATAPALGEGDGERARSRALEGDSPYEPPPSPCPGPAAESHASPDFPPAVTPEKSGPAELSPCRPLLRAGGRKVAGGGPCPRAPLTPRGAPGQRRKGKEERGPGGHRAPAAALRRHLLAAGGRDRVGATSSDPRGAQGQFSIGINKK